MLRAPPVPRRGEKVPRTESQASPRAAAAQDAGRLSPSCTCHWVEWRRRGPPGMGWGPPPSWAWSQSRGLPAPTQGSADPVEPGPPVPGWGRLCPVSTCRPTHTQKSSFCTPARAAEVINIRAGAAIKVRPGDAARPPAPCTVVPPKLAPGSPHLSRGKVCSPLWNSEATPELTEPERERKMEK